MSVTAYTTAMITKESESSVETPSSVAASARRTARTASMRVVATIRKMETQTSFVRRSVAAAKRPDQTSLLDRTGNAEDGEVHRDQEAAAHAAQEDHQQRFNHRGQSRHGGIQLVIIEIGDLVEHRVHGAGRLSNADHLHHHARKHACLQ